MIENRHKLFLGRIYKDIYEFACTFVNPAPDPCFSELRITHIEKKRVKEIELRQFILHRLNMIRFYYNCMIV